MNGLKDAFDIKDSGELVAAVGGGGKTSLLFALARALQPGVVVTTTTRIFAAQISLAPAVCCTSAPAEELAMLKARLTAATRIGALSDLDRFIAEEGICLLIGKVAGDKAMGVPPELAGELLARRGVRHVLVEADGSRMRPIKAPAEHEPVIPPQATLVIPVVGIEAVDGLLDEMAHRPERLRRLLALPDDQDRLTPEQVAALLMHPAGGLKGVPETARVVPFINKVETMVQLQAARRVARAVLTNRASEHRVPQLVIGAARSARPVHEVHRRVTAVVLAAGQASRMGTQKLLLPWGETTVLGRTLRQVRESAVHATIAVSGHDQEAVARIADMQQVPVVHNPNAAAGGEMITSLQAAIRQLPPAAAAVMVVLGDQPLVRSETMDRLLEAFWQGKGELIAPAILGRRGNPVLIARRYFAELLALPPTGAPRDLLRHHAADLHLVEVEDRGVLQDIDDLETYARLRPADSSSYA